MGTHPIFESDFDCLTEWLQVTQLSLLKRCGRCELIKSTWHSRSKMQRMLKSCLKSKELFSVVHSQNLLIITNEMKKYRNEIDLFGKVKPADCGYQIFGRCIKCLMPRQEIGEYWPRLTKEKRKIHWLKVDFSRWRDEDDDEGEDKLDSDFDMNKMLNQLRIDENGKEKGIEDFDDLDEEDSDDEDIDI